MCEVSHDCRFAQFGVKKVFVQKKKRGGGGAKERRPYDLSWLLMHREELIETGCLLQASPADLGNAQNSRN